jgi:hypothetical protein
MPHITQTLIKDHIVYKSKDKEVKLNLCRVRMKKKRCIGNNIKGKVVEKKMYSPSYYSV